MRFTEFFWDFDGTLFDTYPRMLRAFLKGLGDHGIDAEGGEALAWMKESLGAAAEHYAAESGGRASAEELLSAYRAHSEEESFDTMKPYPGTEGMLRAVRERGGHNYLFTHRGETALPALGREGLDIFFRDAVTRSMGFAPKPAPDGLVYLMDKYRLDADACIMIGDREMDLLSGVRAGMACALFDADGYGELCRTRTPYRAGSMEALQKMLIES